MPDSGIPVYPFRVPPLRFGYGALEPHIDAATMRLHHESHHPAYVEALNEALKDQPSLHRQSIETILRQLGEIPEPLRTAVRHHGGGHANHQFLWKVIGPPGTRPPPGLLAAIEADFGSFEKFRTAFADAALGRLGSGWAFLVLDPVSDRLQVLSLPDNDSVLTIGKLGLLICDLWEHACGIKHRNRRADYLDAFWKIVDWTVVAARLAEFRARARSRRADPGA